jgi:hypothetical protein
MARMNLDASFFSDPRIELLGDLTGEGKFSARGRLTGVWHYCYNHTKEVLSCEETNLHSGWFNKNDVSFGDCC